LSLVAAEIGRRKRNSIDSVLQFPKNLGAHSILLIFRKYSYKKPGTRALNKVTTDTYSSQNLEGTTTILLPLPQSIQDSFQVRIQRFDQGIGGEAMAASAASIQNSGGGTLGDFGRALGAAIPSINTEDLKNLDFSTLSRDAAFLARRTLDKIAPEITKNLDAGFGSTINPKAALYFEGVEMKQHSFNWMLAPTSFDESDTIRNIGNAIKKSILPSYGSVLGGGVERLLLNYPNVVDIYFLGIDQSYFMYFKTCMVQQFNIDFTPQGLAIVKGGKPAMVGMTMNLIETDIHTSEDYGGSSESFPGSDTRSPPGDPTFNGAS
jgi:hypothetical protein